jgi:hypothetical protein
MSDPQSSSAAIPGVPVRGSRTRVAFATLAFAWAIVSAVNGPVTAQETSPTPASESPAAVDIEALLEGIDFGSGAAVVTIGDERYEFSMATETIGSTTYFGVCRELFGLIQAAGHVTGRAITVGIEIPPVDWDSYEDQRYDPPSIEVDIDDPYATWVADADWAAANGVEGQSQVDAYQKDGLYAAGSATFFEAGALFQDPPGAPVQGTFEVRCADAE